jgi:hypothetical protein
VRYNDDAYNSEEDGSKLADSYGSDESDVEVPSHWCNSSDSSSGGEGMDAAAAGSSSIHDDDHDDDDDDDDDDVCRWGDAATDRRTGAAFAARRKGVDSAALSQLRASVASATRRGGSTPQSARLLVDAGALQALLDRVSIYRMCAGGGGDASNVCASGGYESKGRGR